MYPWILNIFRENNTWARISLLTTSWIFCQTSSILYTWKSTLDPDVFCQRHTLIILGLLGHPFYLYRIYVPHDATVGIWTRACSSCEICWRTLTRAMFAVTISWILATTLNCANTSFKTSSSKMGWKTSLRRSPSTNALKQQHYS